MAWKNWPCWLKGIIIGFIFGLIINYLEGLFIGGIGWVKYHGLIILLVSCFITGLMIDKKKGHINIAAVSFLNCWLVFLGYVIIGLLIGQLLGMGATLITILAGVTLLISPICILAGWILNKIR